MCRNSSPVCRNFSPVGRNFSPVCSSTLLAAIAAIILLVALLSSDARQPGCPDCMLYKAALRISGAQCNASLSLSLQTTPLKQQQLSLPQVQRTGRHHGFVDPPYPTHPPTPSLAVVAVCLPMTSKSFKNAHENTEGKFQHIQDLAVDESPIFSVLLPSLWRSTPHNGTGYILHVYVTIDDNDTFWLRHLPRLSASVKRVIIVPHRNRTVPLSVAPRAAYNDGADYIVRVNDDTEFVTNDWVLPAIAALRAMRPPNVGVVAPSCGEGMTSIFTHDMTHRTHLDIFPSYYPQELGSWWTDDWITLAYYPYNAHRMYNWAVRHHTHKAGTRYYVDRAQAALLGPLVACARERIGFWRRERERRTLIVTT